MVRLNIRSYDYVFMKLADSLETKRVRLVLVHISAEVETFLLSMGVLFNTRTRRHVSGRAD